jgi:hypothetical protein
MFFPTRRPRIYPKWNVSNVAINGDHLIPRLELALNVILVFGIEINLKRQNVIDAIISGNLVSVRFLAIVLPVELLIRMNQL